MSNLSHILSAQRYTGCLLSIVFAALSLHAQLKPVDLSWQMGEKSLQMSDWDGVGNYWQGLIETDRWSFPR